MKNKIVKKLWQGKYLSVRDYEIEQAIRLALGNFNLNIKGLTD
jgi:hypothetical protein